MATVLFGHKGCWQLLSLKPTSIAADPAGVCKWAQLSLYATAVNKAIAMAFLLFGAVACAGCGPAITRNTPPDVQRIYTVCRAALPVSSYANGLGLLSWFAIDLTPTTNPIKSVAMACQNSLLSRCVCAHKSRYVNVSQPVLFLSFIRLASLP